MKSKRKYKLLGRTVAFIITLILMICIMAIGLFYYIFSIPEPYGISITDFPKNFTNSYTVWTTYGEIILRNVNHTEKLINDLKMTYQLDSGAFAYSPKETQLTRFIRELVIDIVNDPAFSNRNIEFESNTDECIVLIDPDLFRRAIQNIIINALTHNPPETKVLISTRIDVQSNVHISICDNGVGISEDELPELFSRYYRGTSTKEKSEGSGLGLAIAKQIIELHGGNITVSSKRGKGTKFEISIPEQRK